MIKQGIIRAYDNPRYENTQLSVKGLVFFATPHNGGAEPYVTLGNVAANIARTLGTQKSDNIIKTLQQGNLFSDLVQDLFRHRLLDCPIVSFWGEHDRVRISLERCPPKAQC